jgi:hypothetical protein
MFYRLAADVVVVLHAAYVWFVVFGQLAILIGILRRWAWVRNKWFRWLHLLAISIVVFESLLGIVCPLTTLEGWLRAVGSWDAVREEETAQLLRFQEGALRGGEATVGNLHSVQRRPSSAPLPPALASFMSRPGPRFLLATNVVGDSSILRRSPIFTSQRDWLRQTIDYFRARPDWSLIVRAHPDEARLGGKVVLHMGDVARPMAASAPNVLVIGGDEDVISYSLMTDLCAGLVWISSVGVDMVARGIPVLATARPKYHDLGLVEEPRTPAEYFSALTGLAASRVRATAEQQAKARQYLNLVFSEFSFDAFSPWHRAVEVFLDGPASPADAEVFYRILGGDLPPETPPRREARQVA